VARVRARITIHRRVSWQVTNPTHRSAQRYRRARCPREIRDQLDPGALLGLRVDCAHRRERLSEQRAILSCMNGSSAASVLDSQPAEYRPRAAAHAAPAIELEPLTKGELTAWFRGGELEADECEKLLAWAARARGAIELTIAEGLHALRRGDRLAQLGYHLDDYGREVLDIGETTTRKLARLGAELRDRVLLREALRSGKVSIRAAETVLPVAVGDAEAHWVDRAARDTVRELEKAVRRVRSGVDADEEWLRLRTHLPEDDRAILDVGLEVAGEVEPGLSRIERLEAMAQEYLGEHSMGDGTEERPLVAGFRQIGPGDPHLERETELWAGLPAVAGIAAPDVGFDELATAQEIDSRVRELAKLRAGWDDLVGWCTHVIKRSGMPALLGFATFRRYVEERLGLPPRAVEQREALERRLWASPALREARRQKVSYEKLRVLSRLAERDIGSWTSRAHALTCIELRRRVLGERDRQMSVARTFAISMPRRMAALLAAAIHTVRRRAQRALSVGKCLSIIACHFIETWKCAIRPAQTRAQRVRERDQGNCQVPGCSHAAVHAHHVEFRSRGGSDDLDNLVAMCGFHHLRGVHGGYLRVVGRAPDALTWFLNGDEWGASAGAASLV
jgi:hypothetical protein